MTRAIGICGGPSSHLPPQAGRAVLYEHGPYAARLAPSMLQKMLIEAPAKLWLALLTRLPNPDGASYEELVADGYARQPVALTSFSADFEANVSAVAIHLASGADVKGVGLFDAEGRLRFYGFCAGHQRRPELPRSFEFPAFELKVRRFKPAFVLEPRV